jgi:predicted PurR-regulated permease PerM
VSAPPAFAPQRPFFALGTLVLSVAILYWGQTVLIPLALAVLLAFALTPLVTLLQRRGLSRTTAVLTSVLLAVAVIGGSVWVVSIELGELARDLPGQDQAARNKIIAKFSAFRGDKGGVVDKLTGLFDEIEQAIRPKVAEAPQGGVGETAGQPTPVKIVSDTPTGWALFPVLAGPAVRTLGSAGLVVGLVISILLKREDLRNRLIRLTGHGRLTTTTRAIDEATRRISRYLLMQVLVNAAFGLVYALGLSLLGVKYAVLAGFLGAVLRFIPYVGTWLAGVFPVLVSLVLFDRWTEPLLVVGLTVGLGVLTNNVVEPMVVSRSTGVSPIALVLAAAFWTWLWGPIGLVLATPMTVCLGVLGRYVAPLEFFDVLLGVDPALDPQVVYYQRLLARDEDEASELVEEYLQAHPVEELYDGVLVPALLMAKSDRDRGELDDEDYRAILETTRDIMNRTALSPLPADSPMGKGEGAADGEAAPGVLVCCPARDASDELALEMFRNLLAAAGGRVELTSTKTVTAEVLGQVAALRPAAVCIAALPPGGLAQSRYLCKRLRGQFPNLPILIGRWGGAGEDPRVAEQLLAAGATQVAGSLVETRQQAVPLLRVAPHLKARA